MSTESHPVWFETHAHLSDPKFDEDRKQIITNCFNSNIGKIIEIADGPQEWLKAKKLAEQYPEKMVWAGGIHPYYAEEGTQTNFDTLKNHTSDSLFVAIGEVGLDYFKCRVPKETQIQTFQRAIQLSKSVNLPLIVHCREAYQDLLPILSENFTKSIDNESKSPGVIHCFSGTAEEAKKVMNLGFFVGVDGPLTYPNAQPLRDVFKSIPLNKIVLETDSPYLPPQPHRGKRNDPCFLPLIGQALADLKGVSVQEVASQTFLNSLKLFRLK